MLELIGDDKFVAGSSPESKRQAKLGEDGTYLGIGLARLRCAIKKFFRHFALKQIISTFAKVS